MKIYVYKVFALRPVSHVLLGELIEYIEGKLILNINLADLDEGCYWQTEDDKTILVKDETNSTVNYYIYTEENAGKIIGISLDTLPDSVFVEISKLKSFRAKF
jgi:hypothetical protein